MVVIYFSANAYLIDAFPNYVASALAAKTVCVPQFAVVDLC